MSGIVLSLWIIIGAAVVFSLLTLTINKRYRRITDRTNIRVNVAFGYSGSAAAAVLSFFALMTPVEAEVPKLGGSAVFFALVAMVAVINAAVILVGAWWRSGEAKRREQYWRRMYLKLAER